MNARVAGPMPRLVSLAGGVSREEAVKTLRFPQHADLRNCIIEALYHLFTTGKPMFAYP